MYQSRFVIFCDVYLSPCRTCHKIIIVLRSHRRIDSYTPRQTSLKTSRTENTNPTKSKGKRVPSKESPTERKNQLQSVSEIMLMSSSFGSWFLMTMILVLSSKSTTANDNGLALTPPLGWRSWNLFGENVNQSIIERIMSGMVKRTRRDHLGELVSLCDLGYCDVGLDDSWQYCDHPSAAPGMHYHDKYGKPIINTTRFPDFQKMTDHAHSLNLTSGWYGNNCICHDNCQSEEECTKQMKGDVETLLKYNFDSWKLDGCGSENDLVSFNRMIQEKSPHKPIVVENCHGPSKDFKPNRNLPPALGCPYNLYRTSKDIRPTYESILNNLASVDKYHRKNESYPGCWAYPDMLQVGVKDALTAQEIRSHFGAWAIVSSPLILSHDVNDDNVTDKIWNVISNREVLAVNQAYYGDSGGVYEIDDDYQYLSKPIGGEKVAVLLMNTGVVKETLIANFTEIPGIMSSCEKNICALRVRDIWDHKDLGVFDKLYSVSVESHDAAFIVIDVAQQEGDDEVAVSKTVKVRT